MVQKTDGGLGHITTSFEVQRISHGKVPARPIRKSSVGHVVLKKTGTIQHTTMLLAAAKCTRLPLCVGVNRFFFVFRFVLRERHRAAPQSPNAPDTHSPSEEDGRVAIVRVRIFNVSVENETCEAFTENTCRRFGPCGRQLVMSWMELNLCGAADAGGVDGKNIIRSSTTWSVSSHPTVMDVLYELCAPWTAHCCIRRNHMHVTMSASFKPQRNTIYRWHHRLCDCKKLECTSPHTIPPTSLHLSLRHPTTTQNLTDHFPNSLHSMRGHQANKPWTRT